MIVTFRSGKEEESMQADLDAAVLFNKQIKTRKQARINTG